MLPQKIDIEAKMTPRLAMELAAKLRAPDKVLEANNVSSAEFALMKDHPHFQRLYSEAVDFWNSDQNAADRVKAVSTMMVEESLITLFQMTHDPELHPSARLDAFKTLSKLGGLDSAGAVAAAMANHSAGPRFSLNINLMPTGDKPAGQFVIDAEVVEEDASILDGDTVNARVPEHGHSLDKDTGNGCAPERTRLPTGDDLKDA